MAGNESVSPLECRRCGTCCRWPGHVLLDGGDIARLAAAAGLTEEAFIARYAALAANRRQLTLADGPDGACILLDGANCRFYEARPRQCREYPAGWRDTSGCPGMPVSGTNPT